MFSCTICSVRLSAVVVDVAVFLSSCCCDSLSFSRILNVDNRRRLVCMCCVCMFASYCYGMKRISDIISYYSTVLWVHFIALLVRYSAVMRCRKSGGGFGVRRVECNRTFVA